MTYLAEMTLAQRKMLPKEELRSYLNKESEEDAYALNQEFKPISDERLEEIYNAIQAEPDDPDESIRGLLWAITHEVLCTANNNKWSITKTIDELITRYSSEPRFDRITNYFS